ncbi:NUDIX hydrolase [Aeribacillus pallidus]|uniref:NUDIX hydrolase n=1 Tax=Aeribacillus pallidus TaxID=33936 RepID=UPI003D23C0FA
MKTEKLNIFDEQYHLIGSATREEVHQKGHWHETFHCWIISKEDGKDFILFQLRSNQKRDFPSLLDITAAGHLLKHETVQDGVREVQEELGINLSFKQLIPLGVVKDEIISNHFIDRELGNVFLYISEENLDEIFVLQKEEVAGIMKAEFYSFCELWLGERDEITVEGFVLSDSGDNINTKKRVTKDRFLPHLPNYWEQVLKLIKRHL